MRKHPLSLCEECPFEHEPFVPTQNLNPVSRIAVIGEAPGAYEAEKGIPFTGPSGKLLDQVLEFHNINRQDVMVSNICLCRPENNDDPPKAAIAACKPRLTAELEAGGINKILAVGGTAATNLIETKKTITNLRIGGPKPYKEDPSVEIVATWHPAYCVAPNTRILTANLHWSLANDIEIGQELIGFEEDENRYYGQRRLEPSIVTQKSHLILPCYTINTNVGSVTVSSDHMWLAKEVKSYWTPFKWIRTDKLVKGRYRIAHYIKPWEIENSRDAGYIAGFLDGEGFTGHSQLFWAQNDGPTSDHMLQLVKNFGFEITKSNISGSNCKRFAFRGKVDSITALGMFRPERLIANSKKLWLGKRANIESVIIDSVKFAGNQEVVSISTTTKTFIAEGFLSHNCLRSPDNFPSFVDDTAKLNGWTDVHWPEPNYRVFTNKSDIREAIRRLRNLKTHLVIDIESGIDKDNVVVHPENYDLLCLGIAYAKGRAVVLGGRELYDNDVRNELAELLRTKQIIAHNGKFDLGGLYPLLGPLNLFGDTMLMSYSLDERPGHHGLKKLAIEKLGAPDYEEEIRKYVPRGGNYADIPPEILYKYNAYDVACTWDLYEFFNSAFDERAKKLHKFLIRGSNAVRNLEREGIHFDIEYNDLLSEEFLKELYELKLEINEIADRVINPNSVQQVTKYLEDNNVLVTSTEADVLEAALPHLEGRPAYFVKELLLHRKRAKLYGTYVKGMRKRVYDGKIYTTYSLHATTSGRLASRNPNLQNITRDKRIKKQFVVSSPENVFVQADYKQAEGRVITTLAQDEYLAGLFRDPTKDIFNDLCDQIYGRHDRNEERVRIKSVFYGLAYGRGPVAIAQELGISEREGRELLRNFKVLIPATVAWQAQITHKVLSGEDLITPFGRKRSFWLITDQNRSDVINEALSFLPQSIASDICLTALIELQDLLKGLAITRLTVHDALYAECAEKDKEEVSTIMVDTMVKAGLEFTDYIPFAVDVKFGKNWGEL